MATSAGRHAGWGLKSERTSSRLPRRSSKRKSAIDPEARRIVVASMNVLNYFTTLGSRGADTALEFERQQAKIVAAIDGLDADVVGLIELQNNGWGAGSAIGALVEALNQAAGAGTWAAVDPGRPTLGTDEITVGLIYRTATVTPVGAAAVLDSSVDPRFDSSAQRPSLAQTFRDEATGALFTPVVSHLKSKGSSAVPATSSAPARRAVSGSSMA